MRAVKHHETTYNALHHCLEAYFGERNTLQNSRNLKYREAEQGRRTVPFQSSYPLQLDYMARRSQHRFTRIFSLFKNN
ncbi:hypothetical protein P4E94_05110 [Pontiellaceae bacterium B12219]|nr:hypothetical protein [Pontiellaceae bacterium B12219]